MSLPLEFTVKEASTEESLHILCEPQLIKHLPIAGVKELPAYIRHHKYTFYLASFKSHSLIFFFKPYRLRDVYELHIACPKKSIVASRVLALCTAKWIVTEGALGAKALITSCPVGKISNMCTKLGGKIIYTNETTGAVSIMITSALLSKI